MALTAAPTADARTAPTAGERLARAARAQVGVTVRYDAAYARIGYPGGDVPRDRGACTDVVVRAARDGLELDLQRLVHEDMAAAFGAYPSRAAWGLTAPDANIDHRRVPNLEAFWRRKRAMVWRAEQPRAGWDFARPLRAGDILTWDTAGGGPHVGVVSAGGRVPMIVHNMGAGAQEIPLLIMWPHRPRAHFRWPVPWALRS